jgi:hypothetical protein
LIGFGGRVFQQTVGIPIGTKTVFLRFVPFLFEADFIQGVLNKNEQNRSASQLSHFILCSGYIGDVPSLIISKLADC